MQKRTANVGAIDINAISRSSIFDIGDVTVSSQQLNAIAVQKEGAIFSDEGFLFSDYPLFERKRIPHHLEPINVKQRHKHHQPTIHVNKVDILGVSASSIIQVGSLEDINAEARVKHIRILREEQKRKKPV